MTWSYREDYYKLRRNDGNNPLFFNMLSKFKNMALGTFHYESISKNYTERELETMLFDYGQCAIYNQPSIGETLARVDITHWNYLHQPTKVNLFLNSGTSVNGVDVNDNCILITDTQTYGYGRKNTLSYWADKYATVQTVIDMQLLNQQTPLLVIASDPKDIKKLEMFVIDKNTGQKVMVIDPGMYEALKVLDFKAPFNVDVLIQLQKEYENRMLEQCGIDSVQSFGKKEREIVDEQESNDDKLGVILEACLKPRRDAMKIRNKVYGGNTTIDLISPTRITSETDLGDGKNDNTISDI